MVKSKKMETAVDQTVGEKWDERRRKKEFCGSEPQNWLEKRVDWGNFYEFKKRFSSELNCRFLRVSAIAMGTGKIAISDIAMANKYCNRRRWGIAIADKRSVIGGETVDKIGDYYC